MPAHPPARQLTLAAAAIGLTLLGVLPRVAAEHPSQDALHAGAALIVVGLALDAYGRAAGALAARAARERPEWIWACALGGAPAAAVHALVRAAARPGEPRLEPVTLSAILAFATFLAILFAIAGDAR